MVAIGISEFTFGFAFLHEQTVANWTGLRVCPLLPSLQEENDQGWDAKLPLAGIDYYYQFKLSEYLSRANASFIADGTYSEPYYRIALHRREQNRQHRKLRDLCRSNQHVYYVAPEIHSLDLFNEVFLGKRLLGASRLIPVQSCADIVDGDQHYITFQRGRTTWTQHSQPKRSRHSWSGVDLQAMYEEHRRNWRPLNVTSARELLDRVMESVDWQSFKDNLDNTEGPLGLLTAGSKGLSKREALTRAAQITSVFFGSTLVLVGSDG